MSKLTQSIKSAARSDTVYTGTIIAVGNNHASVRISRNGHILTMLKVVGGDVKKDEEVFIDHSRDIPVILANTPRAIATASDSRQTLSYTTLPAKATGAEIVSGTDDAKFVTPKAMTDALKVTGGGSTHRIFTKVVADNSATSIFRIETTNESGSNDAGGYSVFVHALITHLTGVAGGGGAVKSFAATFARIQEGTGTGVNSAVSEIVESASAATNPAGRDIGTVTMTVLETSEYLNDVQFTVDATGSAVTTLTVTVIVDLIWNIFTTPPVLSQL